MEAKPSRGFRDLVAWQKADGLASLVYRTVKDLPPQHKWLVDQVLRCAISVPANLAEGHARGSLAELTHFVDIARGSLAELEYFIHFMKQETILPPDKVSLLEVSQAETSRLLFGFWSSLSS
jgi:four helix bundle protein